LFGYKRGAFTGAVSDKKGKFVLADKGTIFLDEIGDLNFNLQSKLLRVIQEKTIEPLGSEKGIKVDVRIITATNKDLFSLVKQGKFREDLYYRINVITLNLPDLKDRKDDIPLLVKYFIDLYSKKYKKNIRDISSNCLKCLIEYNWPGNIRELENIIERAVILSPYDIIDERVLPPYIAKHEIETDKLEDLILQEIKSNPSGIIFKNVMEKIERCLIDYAMIKFNNKQSKAAEFLGIHRNTMREKIKYYKINK